MHRLQCRPIRKAMDHKKLFEQKLNTPRILCKSVYKSLNEAFVSRNHVSMNARVIVHLGVLKERSMVHVIAGRAMQEQCE